MGVRVDQNLERMRSVLHHGDVGEAALAVEADDEIDAMQVSLTERCYDLLAREQPVASDLRLIVSVVRITAELERIGDLALRVAKLAPDQGLLARSTEIFDLLAALADLALDHYRLALRAFAGQSTELAEEVSAGSPEVSLLTDRLVGGGPPAPGRGRGAHRREGHGRRSGPVPDRRPCIDPRRSAALPVHWRP